MSVYRILQANTNGSVHILAKLLKTCSKTSSVTRLQVLNTLDVTCVYVNDILRQVAVPPCFLLCNPSHVYAFVLSAIVGAGAFSFRISFCLFYFWGCRKRDEPILSANFSAMKMPPFRFPRHQFRLTILFSKKLFFLLITIFYSQCRKAASLLGIRLPPQNFKLRRHFEKDDKA